VVFFAIRAPKANTVSKIKKSHTAFYLEYHFSFAGIFFGLFFWRFGFSDSIYIKIEKIANTLVVKIR